MADAKEKTIALISSTATCNLAAVATTEKVLYTVPTGKTLVVTNVILRKFSGDEHATPPIITLGIGGGACDEYLGDQTINVTANYAEEYLMLRPVQAATPVTGDCVPAASSFSMEITQANGAALTCTIDVFGYLF